MAVSGFVFDFSSSEKFKTSPLVSAHPSWALIKWLLAELFRTSGVISHSSPHDVRSSTHAVERVTSRTAGYGCVDNATVRELKGGDPRTDRTRKGTTRTPGWHLDEAAS